MTAGFLVKTTGFPVKTTGFPGVWKNCVEGPGVPVRTGRVGKGLVEVVEVVGEAGTGVVVLMTGDTARVGNGLLVDLAVVLLLCVVLMVVLAVVVVRLVVI